MTSSSMPARRAIPSSTAREAWSVNLGRGLLERFALLAFGLYHVPLFLNNYPTLGGGGFRQDGLAVR